MLDFPWNELAERTLKAPFIPDVKFIFIPQRGKENFDSLIANRKWTDNPEHTKEGVILLRDESLQKQFEGYQFDIKMNKSVLSKDKNNKSRSPTISTIDTTLFRQN